MLRYQSLTNRLIPDKLEIFRNVQKTHQHQLTCSHTTRLLSENLLMVVDKLEEVIGGMDETLDSLVGLCLGLLAVNPKTRYRNKRFKQLWRKIERERLSPDRTRKRALLSAWP